MTTPPVLAVDFGGTIIKAGIVRAGKVTGLRTLPAEAERGLRAALPRVAEALRSLAGDELRACSGVGVTFPGIVDCRAKRIISTPQNKYDDAPTVDLPAWAQAEFGLPVKVENDAHAALLGEWQHGAGRGADNLVMLTLGTGIGGSVIMAGRPVRGRQWQTGLLLGHIVVNPNGHPCYHAAEARGCVEAETGTWTLPAIAREQPGYAGSALAREARCDYEAVFRLAATGDPVALALRNRSLDLWAAAVISLIHVCGPERVILGGGVLRSAAVIVPWVQQRVDAGAWLPSGPVPVVCGRYLEEAALLGAAVMVEQEIDFI